MQRTVILMLRGASLTHGIGIEKVAISRIDQGSFIEDTNRDGLSLLAVRGDEGKRLTYRQPH